MEEAGLNHKDTIRTDFKTKLQNLMFCGRQELTRTKTQCSGTKIKVDTASQVLKEWLDRIETKLDMCRHNLKTSQALDWAV